MPRVTQEEVRAIIDDDVTISLAPAIETATVVVDHIVSKDDQGLLNADLKKEIERYLAAHFYEHRDPQYEEKKTGDASAVFQGEWGKGLDSSKWGQTAKMLDVTGELGRMGRETYRATLDWLGLPPSEQTPYVDRD